MKHYSVLKKELINGLNIKEDGIYVDATLGYAGDAKDILRKLKRGFLFAFDKDIEAINYSKEKLSKIGSNFKIIHSDFVNLKAKLLENDITKVDGIIFDLGLSSPQIDNPDRGFTFMNDANLDMRMNNDDKLTAYDIVNNYSLEQLIEIFYSYGEERYSKSIAKNIVEKRRVSKIKTTKELVDIILTSVPTRYFNLEHPERRIFQALRISVNNELESLRKVIPDAINLLNKDGRLAIITFHSLEDRIVKQTLKKYSEVDSLVRGLKDIPEAYKPLIKLINKKPILPTDDEIKENSRSKSAKLRIAERI